MGDYIRRKDAIVAAWEGSDEWDGGSNRHRDKCIEMHIKAIPAADVAPVRHGRWIKSPECPEEYDICSVCGMNDKHRSRGDADHPALESIPPFCKWCGAKLDEEDQNDRT